VEEVEVELTLDTVLDGDELLPDDEWVELVRDTEWEELEADDMLLEIELLAPAVKVGALMVILADLHPVTSWFKAACSEDKLLGSFCTVH